MRLLVVMTLLVVAAWPSLASAQTQQSIVVLVNDEPITTYDVSQRMLFMQVTARQGTGAQEREKTIEELITERLQLQEAKKEGIIIDEGQVNEVIDNIARRNNLTGEQLSQALQQRGINIKTLKDRIKASLAWRSLIKKKFRYQVIVGEADVEKALASGAVDGEAAGTGREKTEFQLQRVLLDTGANADQKVLAARLVEAEALRSRFNSCAALPGLMRNLRDAAAHDVGRRAADDIPQPARALLLAASAGQMTPPMVTASGIELYAVCARHTVQANDEQRRTLQAKIADEEYQRLARGYLGDLRASAFVERLDKTR